MNLKPWRTIARPHHDVLHGTFRQAEFAADIARVAAGEAEAAYQDPKQFFARTFITEGMRDLLVSVAKRLSGQDGDPVIQLQTNFGGGKTHTLLAVYHLATQAVPTADMEGIPTLLDDAGITELPKARVAVIDGISLSANQATEREGLRLRTLWGVLAYQLLGKAGYEMVEESDRSGTAPGKELLIALLRQAAPCVILMDELVAFLRNLDDSKHLLAGTLAANMTFIQALTESVKAVPNAIVLASLPESNTETVGSQGALALDSLEKYFGRIESVWKPVGQNESFEIVRRRLFDTTGNEADVEQVCTAYAAYYRANKDKLPAEVQENRYLEKMRHSYPIHPEVFDRLYEDWSTLDKFQRTRGVLQYMAIVIHRLWQDNDQDPMLMPGSLPLYDLPVRTKSTQYLPQGWDIVITKEIDGETAESLNIDSEPRFGAVQAARRVARTIFLGSAPASSAQTSRGIDKQRILLGCARPGDELSVYDDVTRRLRDRMHYLFGNGERFWFDTHPNLRREMESRKAHVDEAAIFNVLKRETEAKVGRNSFFCAQHVFTPIGDIPDEIGSGPRLVILPPLMHCVFSKQNREPAKKYIYAVLGHSAAEGELLPSRQRLYKNCLVFLAPDAVLLPRLLDQARTYLAWDDMRRDVANGAMNMDTLQVKNLEEEINRAKESLQRLIPDCYKNLLVPTASDPRTVEIAARTINITGMKLTEAVRNCLQENDYVIPRYSPMLLKQALDKYYFGKGLTELSIERLWKDMCSYYYFDRLHDMNVLEECIREGLSCDDYFGYATGKDGEEYTGFVYGSAPMSVHIDASSLLLSKEQAEAYRQKLRAAEAARQATDQPTTPENGGNGTDSGTTPSVSPGTGTPPVSPQEKAMRRFSGTIQLDPDNPQELFQNVVTEIVSHFTKRIHTKVTITVDIEAETQGLQPFESNIIRTIKENANTLGFRMKDFYDS